MSLPNRIPEEPEKDTRFWKPHWFRKLIPIVLATVVSVALAVMVFLLLTPSDRQAAPVLESAEVAMTAVPAAESAIIEVPGMMVWVVQAGSYSTPEKAEAELGKWTDEFDPAVFPQGELHALWVYAAPTEEAAKEFASRYPDQGLYVKQVETPAFELEGTESDLAYWTSVSDQLSVSWKTEDWIAVKDSLLYEGDTESMADLNTTIQSLEEGGSALPVLSWIWRTASERL